jgi:hypothetical protein
MAQALLETLQTSAREQVHRNRSLQCSHKARQAVIDQKDIPGASISNINTARIATAYR